MFDSLERQAARAVSQDSVPPPSSLLGRYLSLDEAEERDDVAACYHFCASALALASLTERCDAVVARLLHEAGTLRDGSGMTPGQFSAPQVRVNRYGSVMIDSNAARTAREAAREAELPSSSDDDEAWRDAHRRAIAVALESEAADFGGDSASNRSRDGDGTAPRVHVTRRGSIDIVCAAAGERAPISSPKFALQRRGTYFGATTIPASPQILAPDVAPLRAVALDPAEFATQERAEHESRQQRLRQEDTTRVRLRKRKVAAQARKVRLNICELVCAPIPPPSIVRGVHCPSSPPLTDHPHPSPRRRYHRGRHHLAHVRLALCSISCEHCERRSHSNRLRHPARRRHPTTPRSMALASDGMRAG